MTANTDIVEVTTDNLEQYTEASTTQIENHLDVLYQLAEHDNNELVKEQVNNVWQNALQLRTTANTAIDTAVAARELAKTVQQQRNQVIEELSTLQKAIDTMDMDHAKVNYLMEAVTEECWEEWVDELDSSMYNETWTTLNALGIEAIQVLDEKILDVVRLLLNSITGKVIGKPKSEELFKQLIESLIEEIGHDHRNRHHHD